MIMMTKLATTTVTTMTMTIMTKIGLSRHNRGHFGGGLHSQSLDCY